jgi:MoaA/NifB/PqqE/SkfB family radical SAM enzyme/polysaccharide pyruvyl transferase WcaK-like protein
MKRHSGIASARKVWRGFRMLVFALARDIRFAWLGSAFPPNPAILQLLVNDICNSHCVMCNIWRQAPVREITLEDLGCILADPLFSGVRSVDLTGGEPTLRGDLPAIGRAIVECLPKLAEVQLSTNAMDSPTVIRRATALADTFQVAGVRFTVSVSVDGVGNDHDRIRGVEGNFASAVEVIRTLQQSEIPVAVTCTLTPWNCYGADDVLLWYRQQGIRKWAFRIGVEVKRYHNEGYDQEHPFDPEQRFHVALFFDKLARLEGIDLARRFWYQSLSRQMALNLSRKATCDWQVRGVTLDMQGNLGYCPARSPILGSAVDRSALWIYREGMPRRKEIVRGDCRDCRYDLSGWTTAKEVVSLGTEALARTIQRRRVPWPGLSRSIGTIRPADRPQPKDWTHVLITGWYGTETAGDKAILGELLHFLAENSPGCRITLTTLDPIISRQTQLELAELSGSTLVEMRKGCRPELIESVDAVIIGGGPLMEITYMEYIRRMFAEANRRRKARVIFGCGIGPLYTDRMRRITGDILRMTTAGFFRDAESHEYAVRHARTDWLGYACDPALAYVRRWRSLQRPRGTGGSEPARIAGLLRENTRQFAAEQCTEELDRSNARAAEQLAQILEAACTSVPAWADLLAMNNHELGGDDRLFNRRIAGFFRDPDLVRVERGYLPIEALLQSLYSADAVVAMRYHGHLFSMALGIPFLSVDYSGESGKVQRLIRRIEFQQWSEEWGKINVNRAAARLNDLVEEQASWSVVLMRQADRLVADLDDTCRRIFVLSDGG